MCAWYQYCCICSQCPLFPNHFLSNPFYIYYYRSVGSGTEKGYHSDGGVSGSGSDFSAKVSACGTVSSHEEGSDTASGVDQGDSITGDTLGDQSQSESSLSGRDSTVVMCRD